MRLTPLDIKKQEFKKAFRGLDTIEVETFLEMVADEYENLIREKNELADEILKLKTQLGDYQEVEKTLKETLMHAQQNISDSRENSRREAEMIIRDADYTAEKIIEDAKLKLAEIKNELVIVKAQKDSFARRLRHLLISQLDLIEVLELDDLGFDKLQDTRSKRRKAPKKNQEEIEFEGIDAVFPEETVPKGDLNTAAEAKDNDSRERTNWGENEEQKNEEHREEHKIEQDEEKKTRISDKLIF